MDALQRGGIKVVPVTDDFAERFIREHERADKAQFRYVGQHLLYSNAAMALESIKQQRATPTQWLGMLRNAGGIKEGEDRWTGLSEWLLSHPERLLDKQQISEYLNAHAINLQEEHFTEIHKSEHFKELQHELDSLAEAVDENYRQADNEYDSFMTRMTDQYGEDWSYEMTAEEAEEEEQLLEERDKWDTFTQSAHEIAFNQMEEKYGSEFNEAFNLLGSTLEVYDELEASRFIANWTIDERRMECTTQNLDNYHELAFWVENIASWDKTDLVHFGEVGQGRCIGWVRFGDTIEKRKLTDTEIRHKLDAMPGIEAWTCRKGGGLDGADLYFPPGYNSRKPFSYIMQRQGETTANYVPFKGSPYICHSLRDAVRQYNELNVPRTEDTRVLVIDEIQSYRHQKGRKKGYRMTEEELEAHKKHYTDIYERHKEYRSSLQEKYGTDSFAELVNGDEQQKLDNFKAQMKEVYDSLLNDSDRVERAPFEKNWHELCMKRMLRYAAEEGYDKLAWTTGQQQEIRYDTAKYIDVVRRATDDRLGRLYYVKLIQNQYESRFHTNDEGRITGSSDGWDGENVEDVFGKDMAQQIMAMQPETLLQVGGKSTRSKSNINQLYDNILPQFMNRYGKKWGIVVRPLELSNIAEVNGYHDRPFLMHSVDVTPAMKQSVMQGQPMFMKDRSGQVYGWTLDGTIYLTPRGMNAETGIHEYTHLWAEIMRQKDRPAWEHVKFLLRDTPIWKQVTHDRNYRNLRGDENRIASEALARISGRDNTAKLDQVVHQVTSRNRSLRGLEAIKQALGKFWSWVGRHVFNIRQARTITDVTDRILGDLLRGTKPERHRPEKTGQVTDIQFRMFGQHPNQVPRLRCKIDGEQQMYTDITRKEVEALQRERDPQKRAELQHQLVQKYFAYSLHPSDRQSVRR